MIVEQIEKMIGGTTYFSLDSGRVASHEGGESLSFGDIAVLFRLNALGDPVAEALSRSGIPFVRSGEKPLMEGFPVNVIRRYLLTVLHPGNEYYRVAYRRILKDNDLGPPPSSVPPVTGVPRTGISSSPLREEGRREGKGGGEQALLELIDHAVTLHGFVSMSEEGEERLRRLKDLAKGGYGDLSSFLDALSLDRGIDHEGLLGDRVALMSLHAAKGLEWPVVFIIGCEDQLLPCTLFGDRDEEEEKRLFYVGMTRARTRLVLSWVKRRRINGRLFEMKPSPFISLVPKDLRKPLERKAWKPRKKPPDQLQLF
jgi:DNA helicase-2/ATP-dependent DNA helicase PcrA